MKCVASKGSDEAMINNKLKGATPGSRKHTSAGQGLINISVIPETGESWDGWCTGGSCVAALPPLGQGFTNTSVITETGEGWEGLVVCPVLSTYLSSLRQERGGRGWWCVLCYQHICHH